MNIFRIKSLIVFYQELLSLTGSGVNLFDAAEVMHKYGDSPDQRALIRDLQKQVSSGRSLSEAMSTHGDFFPKWHIEVARYSEVSGTLNEGLQSILSSLEEEYEVERRLMMGMAYPFICLHIFIFFFPISSLLISRSLFSYLFEVLRMFATVYFGIGLVWLAWFICVATPLKCVIDHFILYIPGVGKAVRSMDMARVMMAFKSLYNAGIDPRTSWLSSAQLCGNAVLKKKFLRGVSALEKGESLEAAFARTGLLPSKMMGMIAAGEKGGDLKNAMNRVLMFYQKERDVILRFYTRFAGMLFLFVVLAFVLLAVFRFYMNLFDKIAF